MSVVSKLSVAALGFATVASVAAYAWLPERMPIHFDLDGHANGFASRAFGAFLLPAVMLGLVALERVLRAKNRAIGAVTALTAWFMLSLHLLVLRAALWSGELGDAMWLALGAMFVGIGLLLPRVKRNAWVGVRTRWSMSSPEAWARTHHAAGRVMVACGAGFALSSVMTGASASGLRIVSLVVLTIVPIAYSWWIARSLGAS